MDVHSDDVSYAFNINTPEPVIAKLKEAFNKRMKDGSMVSVLQNTPIKTYLTGRLTFQGNNAFKPLSS